MDRSKCRRFFLLVVCLLLTRPIALADDDHLKRFQGTWVGTEQGHEDDGQVTVTIDGDAVEFDGWREGEWYKGTIEVDPTTKPKTVSATIKDCPIKALIDQISNGIYEIDKRTLMITARAPGDPDAPTGFDDPECRTLMLEKQP